MPIYTKTINGRQYLYEQHSKYRPGQAPRSVMRYIGPVNPVRKRKSFVEATFGIPPIDWHYTIHGDEIDRILAQADRLATLYPPPESKKSPVQPVPIEKPSSWIDLKEKGPEVGALGAPQSDDVAAVGQPTAGGSNELPADELPPTSGDAVSSTRSGDV
jgi:hypothetical protein